MGQASAWALHKLIVPKAQCRRHKGTTVEGWVLNEKLCVCKSPCTFSFKALRGYRLRSSASPLFLIFSVMSTAQWKGLVSDNAVLLCICWVCCMEGDGCDTNALWVARFPQPWRRQLGLEQKNPCAAQMRAAAELRCLVGEPAFLGTSSAMQTACL